MPDNFKKPSYNRKQQLYVESSNKKSSQNNKQKSNNKGNSKNISVKNNKEINIPTGKNSKSLKNEPRKKKLPTILLFTFVLVALTSTLALASYRYFTNDVSDVDPNLSQGEVVPAVDVVDAPKNVNVLLVGVDKGSFHTDTMILANLNTVDGSIELISIPRDTYTVLPPDVVEEVRSSQENPIMPRDGEMKLTELITYTQDFDKGLELLTDYVSSLLGVEIENYVAVDLESFSYLIDQVGGVYFDVPRRMYYNDNAQDLHIDLQPGYQPLNGDQAEQLIRFRKGDSSMGSSGYATGDLGRIEVQQAFMKAVINQVLAKENIISNLPSLVKTYYNYVNTNISLLDMPKYAQYALKADKDNITTYTLPVEYDYIDSKSYALTLEDEMKTLIDKVFYDIVPVAPTETTTDDSTTESSKPKSEYVITILNGSGVSGFAGRTSTILQEEGFTISDIGDYTSEKQDNTRLFVNDATKAAIIKDYFDEPEVVVAPGQTEDIIVVLGKNETLKGKEQ